MTDMTLDMLLASLENDDFEKSASETASVSDPAGAPAEVKKSSVVSELEGLLTKEASDKTTSEESTEMNKVAQEQGKAIADAILGMLKKADEGSNAVIQQTEQLVSEADSQTEMTPRNGKTVTETLKGIVARGSSEGAVHPDALSLGAVSGDETAAGPALSNSDGHSVENVGSDLDKEAHEKLAAAQALMYQGYDFETAVDLVKEAAEELAAEEFEQIKLATVSSLVDEGMSIDDALVLTKQAMEILAKQAEEDEDEDEDEEDEKKDKKKEQEKKASVAKLITAGFSVDEALKLVG